MADYGFDGMIKVSFVPTIADHTAPKLTEVAAGTALEARLTPDGMEITTTTANIDTSKLNSTANSATIGRDSFNVSVKYVRGDDTAATAVQTALTRGASGWLVVRRDKLASVPFAAADKVELYPVICARPNPDKPAANALQAVAVPMEVTDGNKVHSVDAQVALA
jgi:hypothetical protein